MAADPVFLDTNVLIYVSRPSAPEHGAARRTLGQLEAEGGALWISQQVLREYLAVATRPQATAPPLPRATALADIRRFRASFEIAADNPSVLDRLLQLLATHSVAGKQVHDANVVATMLDHGVHRLLSFNTADFRPFIGLITLVPLATV
jgi:predicted nucleic acid-binding protein